MQRAFVAAVAACLLFSPAQAQAPKPPTPAVPRLPTLDDDGWVRIDSSPENGTVVFGRAAKQAGKTPRLWVRYETSIPVQIGGRSFRSSASLNEYDCEVEKLRSIDITYYEKNNLVGYSDSITPDLSWNYTRPGTLGYATLQIACAPANN